MVFVLIQVIIQSKGLDLYRFISGFPMLGGIQSHFLIFIVHPEPDCFINYDNQDIGDDERVCSCGPNTHQLNPNLMEITDQ